MRRIFAHVSSSSGARGILRMATRPVDRTSDMKHSVSIALPLQGGCTSDANCCITGLGHGDTARFASQLIGEPEIIHTQVSKSRRPNEWLSSQTTSEHHVTEHAVMLSEIEQLPDLTGFLKLASSPRWRRVNITRHFILDRC